MDASESRDTTAPALANAAGTLYAAFPLHYDGAGRNTLTTTSAHAAPTLTHAALAAAHAPTTTGESCVPHTATAHVAAADAANHAAAHAPLEIIMMIFTFVQMHDMFWAALVCKELVLFSETRACKAAISVPSPWEQTMAYGPILQPVSAQVCHGQRA